jgi:RNA polymerase sigma factor (sigma-70 family)
VTTPDETNKAWICEQVENNLGLVHLLANRHATSRTPFDDLFQEGIFGLWRAIEKFDPQRNIKFSSYAAPWIRTYMRRYVNRVIAPGVNEQPLQQWRREGGVDLHASQIENWTHKHSDITLIDVVEPDTATAQRTPSTGTTRPIRPRRSRTSVARNGRQTPRRIARTGPPNRTASTRKATQSQRRLTTTLDRVPTQRSLFGEPDAASVPATATLLSEPDQSSPTPRHLQEAFQVRRDEQQ